MNPIFPVPGNDAGFWIWLGWILAAIRLKWRCSVFLACKFTWSGDTLGSKVVKESRPKKPKVGPRRPRKK